MPKLLRTLVLLAAIVAIAPPPAAAEPTRDSLLAAWEESQAADPQTLVFEKIEDGRYRFQTERFPFDGVLRVINVVIDDRHADFAQGTVMGMVEVKLEEAPDEFQRDHAYSIGIWQSGNTLYFDQETESWMDASEWQQQIMEQVSYGGLWGWCSQNLFWLVFLLLLVAMLWWVSRKANRQMNRATALQDKAMAEQERAIRLSEEALEISRDSNRILSEVLNVIKSDSDDNEAPSE